MIAHPARRSERDGLMQRTAAWVVVLALATAALTLLPRMVHHAPARRPAVVRPIEPGPAHPEVGFGSRQRLVEHYRKHGREFGPIGMGRYLRLAQGLRDRPAGGLVLEAVRKDGVTVRYDRASGAFLAFDRNGTIRTFFRPKRGDA